MSVEASARVAGSLPHDVRLSPLVPHRDERGTFVELFREEWETGVHPVQWNAVDSEQGAPTAGAAACVELSAEDPTAISIPP